MGNFTDPERVTHPGWIRSQMSGRNAHECGRATLPFWAAALPGIALAAVLALDPNAAKTRASRDDKSDKLTCGDDKPDKGGMLFKAGTKEKQHIVGVEPNGTGTVFQLLYIEARGEQKKPA
jgi:hypothetical protein